MDDSQAIRARVEAFIRDYNDWNHDCHLTQGIDSFVSPCDFDPDGSSLPHVQPAREDLPRRLLMEVARKHCTREDVLTRHGVAFGTTPFHSPDFQITEITITAPARAVLKTDHTGGVVASWEYILEKRDGVWLIAKMDPFHGEDEPGARTDWSDADLQTDLDPIDDAEIDFNLAFTPGVAAFNVESQTREVVTVRQLGEIDIPSGFLTIVDPGADPSDIRPLALKFPTPKLKIETSCLGDQVAFARIWLTLPTDLQAFIPARFIQTPDEHNHLEISAAPIRSGFLLFADAGAWRAMSHRDMERFVHAAWDERMSPHAPLLARLITLPTDARPAAALLIAPGGDTSCPCYWGLDREQRPAALIVDMRICEESIDEAIVLPFHPQWLTDERTIPQLTEFGADVRLGLADESSIQIHTQGKYVEIDLLDANDRMIGSTSSSGHMCTGAECWQKITFAPPLPDNLRLRIRWHSLRHAFRRPSPFD